METTPEAAKPTSQKQQRESRKILIQGGILILCILILAPLIVVSIYSVAELLSENTTGKYLYLTNIGFALFAGLATLMFNWSRSLDAKDYPYESQHINEIGEFSILGGIGFLLASLFQFTQTMPKDHGILKIVPKIYFVMSPYIILIIFLLTSAIAAIVLFQIISVYADVRHVRSNLALAVEKAASRENEPISQTDTKP
ncbi:hypothetical protein [Pedobacter miscanthi]|uniref:hypothetical protein n=1 Tax=Pedobacter miscanthi TaxID=2259170 RepID=UPI00292CDC45|nr:hypothetical protein [Pedobacter miscanthi]